jgi:hypothetical protein
MEAAATDCVQESAEVAMKTLSTKSLIEHVINRRIEYLVGTLIAHQLGLLDMGMSAAQQCMV